jgi:hypothetical protein
VDPDHFAGSEFVLSISTNVKLNYTFSRKFQIFNTDEKGKTVKTGTAVNKSIKIYDFPTCIKLGVGSGSASKWKVVSGSAYKRCRHTTLDM